jgi:hypothetical protein
VTDDEKDREAIRRGLRAVLRSRGSGSKHQLARASAGRTLARLQGDKPEPPERRKPTDAEDAMAMVVEAFCPDYRQVIEDPLQDADPMRDLDGALQGADVDPVLWSWLPCCPEDVAEAEREVMAAARRLGLKTGPFALPGEGY